jgi:hypothetical protein
MVNFYANHRSKQDGCPYAKLRKKYTRTHPAKTGFLKIKNNPRENVAIIKLRRLGYSINQLADAFGRSTSFIHKRLRTAISRGIIHMVQMRKLPSSIRLLTSSRRRRMLQTYLPLWEAFILGEGDKPP